MGDILNMSLDDIIKKNKEEAGAKAGQGRERGGRALRGGKAAGEGNGRPAPAQLKVSVRNAGVRKAGSGRGRVLAVRPGPGLWMLIREIFEGCKTYTPVHSITASIHCPIYVCGWLDVGALHPSLEPATELPRSAARCSAKLAELTRAREMLAGAAQRGGQRAAACRAGRAAACARGARWQRKVGARPVQGLRGCAAARPDAALAQHASVRVQAVSPRSHATPLSTAHRRAAAA